MQLHNNTGEQENRGASHARIHRIRWIPAAQAAEAVMDAPHMEVVGCHLCSHNHVISTGLGRASLVPVLSQSPHSLLDSGHCLNRMC